jgi:hypothetical protein
MEDEDYLNNLMTKATSRTLDDVANDVRKHLSGAVESIIKAGQALQEGRDMHPSDNTFHDWCIQEFPDLKPRLRLNIMQVGKRFGTQYIAGHTPITVLYELAAPSVPDELVDDILSSNTPIKVKDVQEAKREYKQLLGDIQFDDIAERVKTNEITPMQAIEEKKARMPIVPDYKISDAMGAIRGMAWLYCKSYKGTKEEAASTLINGLINGYEEDDISLSIARDSVKWFLEFKSVLDMAEPELLEFLDDKPKLKLIK